VVQERSERREAREMFNGKEEAKASLGNIYAMIPRLSRPNVQTLGTKNSQKLYEL
jgi:hypothetical protein